MSFFVWFFIPANKQTKQMQMMIQCFFLLKPRVLEWTKRESQCKFWPMISCHPDSTHKCIEGSWAPASTSGALLRLCYLEAAGSNCRTVKQKPRLKSMVIISLPWRTLIIQMVDIANRWIDNLLLLSTILCYTLLILQAVWLLYLMR